MSLAGCPVCAYIIIVINIFIIGDCLHSYNCIIIYHVPCYFERYRVFYLVSRTLGRTRRAGMASIHQLPQLTINSKFTRLPQLIVVAHRHLTISSSSYSTIILSIYKRLRNKHRPRRIAILQPPKMIAFCLNTSTYAYGHELTKNESRMSCTENERGIGELA
jgi:hypothetical protein